MKNKQEIITKTIPDNNYKYVTHDQELDSYIIDVIGPDDDDSTPHPFDYIQTDKELMFYINTAMDDRTSLLIVQADKVEGAPKDLDGYFVY